MQALKQSSRNSRMWCCFRKFSLLRIVWLKQYDLYWMQYSTTLDPPMHIRIYDIPWSHAQYNHALQEFCIHKVSKHFFLYSFYMVHKGSLNMLLNEFNCVTSTDQDLISCWWQLQNYTYLDCVWLAIKSQPRSGIFFCIQSFRYMFLTPCIYRHRSLVG